MADLKLPKLPDRTPVKLTVAFPPDLASDLALYAEFYRQEYGCEEPVGELIPAILAFFLRSDREFARRRKG